MILFIAPNPHKVQEREGFLQRVAAIDEIFASEDRIYLEDLKTSSARAKALIKATLIYVHSIYQAEKIISNYPLLADKIVTDMHGVVPEEEKYMGHHEGAKRMSDVEKKVFKYGKKFVAVSESMAEHFIEKYNLGNNIEWIILPIFRIKPLPVKKLHKKPVVVYAGGAQRWQNVELMIDAINKTYKKYKFKIITHDPLAFVGISKEGNRKTEIRSVPSSQVDKHYKDASYGFILRDDITINRVSCPTKLIEYLGSGIVPIVLSPNIGDFNRLGYSFIYLKDFLKNNLTPESIRSAALNNVKVLEKLVKQTEDGMQKLINIYKTFKQNNTKIPKSYIELVKKNCEIYELNNNLMNLEQQLLTQIEARKHAAELENHYKSMLDEITQSKRWRLMNLLLRPLSIKNKLYKLLR